VLGDTIRHNPGRTVELFRRFLTPGHFYKMYDGAEGYGERLPFDQEELVATLAPRAIVLQSTLDDYADQSVGDALSLTLAKTVYDWLGYDQDMLVMYNYRDGANHGQNYHGEDGGQRTLTAEYLDWYFYGDTMSDTTLKRLQTDPFLNDVIDGQDGYTRNFGGLNAIAPWLDTAKPADYAEHTTTAGPSDKHSYALPVLLAAAVLICAGGSALIKHRKKRGSDISGR
jgi:hypothetical protein